MSEGFSNPIVGGGGALVYPAIHSPNYVLGVTGWSINKDGTAQFTGLVLIGGSFTGTNWIMNNAGTFFYNGTPAAGNLIAWIASANSADQFGNPYTAIIGVENPGHNRTRIDAFCQIDFDSLNPGTKITSGAVVALIDALTNAAQPGLAIEAPATSMGTFLQLRLLGESNDGSKLQQMLLSTAGLPASLTGALAEFQGSMAADSLWVPSSDIPVSGAPAGVETWHGLTGLGYQNSWADSGTNIPGRYRLVTSPPRAVEIEGDLTVGTIADGTLIVTLPANYLPVHSQIIPLTVPSGTPTNPANMRLTVGTDGTIKCSSLAGLASPNRVYFHTFISLD